MCQVVFRFLKKKQTFAKNEKKMELPNQGAKESLENKSSFMAIQILTLEKGINKWAQNGSTLLLKSRIIIIF